MRIGIDLGGTKIAAAALEDDGALHAETRVATPRDLAGTLAAVVAVIDSVEGAVGRCSPGIGLCLPGVVDARQGVVRRAVNLPWLDGHPFAAELERALGRPVRLANDANAFVLSEAADGAAAGAEVVFGAILGTGVGGGIVVDGRILNGANALAGEWGHTPLPWRSPAVDGPPLACACGQSGCVETVLSGAGLVSIHRRRWGTEALPPDIAARAEAGDAQAQTTLDLYFDALARALAGVVNLLDPDAIVIGGGLCGLPGLVEGVRARWGRWTIEREPRTRLARARHGADSGLRGAAWLWPAST
ncbi:ROK family protein [Azospirillum sp. RWY-5-1]|uniref:ROK family protein n=1 Tax=Azospirillum oleiclasticum TaxID=2735135 RepID=A0ABX2TBI6_9PROT|nr:ROK family protein [Azospirillum oleiclasticum]NYZ13268.1 ROK family protein [Azospirillum oleiclasticum]NYZ20060.1 ROK family protein [Azospirillum oleiclasticum]